MAYDVNTGMPLLSKIYKGANNDKVSVKDFLSQIALHNMLFISERGFYSTEDVNLFNSDGNAYIIHWPKTLRHAARPFTV